MFETFKRDWRGILLQSVVSALVLLGLVFVAAYGMGGPQREAKAERDIASVRTLICKTLAQSENPNIVRVIQQECEGI